MRLTKYQRDKIVRAIMADIPEPDFRVQMQDRVNAICIALMPRLIKTAWDDPAMRGFIKCGQYSFCCITVTTPGLRGWDEQARALKEDAELKALHKAHEEQRDDRTALQSKLRANLNACQTAKVFRERFPDLAKYLPEADEETTNVPASAELMASLVAAGLKVAA